MLYEESERLKIRFLAAFDRLQERGLLTAGERDEIAQLLEDMDQYTPEELAARLQVFRDRVGQRAAGGGAG